MHPLESKAQFDELMQGGVALIYKHSSTCGVSLFARQEVEGFVELPSAPRVYEVLVIEQRDLSDYISEVTGIEHKSPQALFLLDGEVVWHGSHYDIEVARLKEVAAG